MADFNPNINTDAGMLHIPVSSICKNLNHAESIIKLRELIGINKVTRDPQKIDISPYSIPSSQFPQFPISLLPKILPHSFEKQLSADIQLFNKLVDNISRDFVFLQDSLKDVIKSDDFTKNLFRIFTSNFESDMRRGHPVMCFNRADFMLEKVLKNYRLVEINTISSGYSCLSAKVFDFHKLLFDNHVTINDHLRILFNKSNKHIVDFLARGVEAFNKSYVPESIKPSAELDVFSKKRKTAHKLFCQNECIIMVVKEKEKGKLQEHLILADGLSEQYNIRLLPLTLGDIGRDCCLDQQTKNLIYNKKTIIPVVYFRAGYNPEDYPSPMEWSVREMLEQANCLKCPTIGVQLAGSKKVQQSLTEKGALHRFLLDHEVNRIAKYFTEMRKFSFSESDIAATEQTIKEIESNLGNWILKPQREGGGNNINSEIEISKILQERRNLEEYVAMKKINCLFEGTVFIKNNECYFSESVGELGVFGSFIRIGEKTPINKHSGYLLRSKPINCAEGGVMRGGGVIDSFVLERKQKWTN